MPNEYDEATEVIEFSGEKPLDTLPPGIGGSLKAVQGPEIGRVIQLQAGFNTVGRDERNTIRLKGRAVSARHAAIYFTESMEWRIKDLGSTNGTLLNGSKVKEFALRSGDKVFIGEYLFVFSG